MSNKMFSYLAAIVCAAVIPMSVCHAEVRSSRVETSLKDGCKIYRAIHFSTVRVCEEMFTPTLTRFLPSSNL